MAPTSAVGEASPIPIPTSPNCETDEYASIRLISRCVTASTLPRMMLTTAPATSTVCANAFVRRNSTVNTVKTMRISAYAAIVETSAEMSALTVSGALA